MGTEPLVISMEGLFGKYPILEVFSWQFFVTKLGLFHRGGALDKHFWFKFLLRKIMTVEYYCEMYALYHPLFSSRVPGPAGQAGFSVTL